MQCSSSIKGWFHAQEKILLILLASAVAGLTLPAFSQHDDSGNEKEVHGND